jgi:type III pantothenate kinase
MTSLLIDAGNSSIKWCLLTGNTLSEQKNCGYDNKPPYQCIDNLITQYADELETVFMVSVLGEQFLKQAQESCFKNKILLHNITSTKKLAGILNGYDEPSKLGADRLVAMIGAKHNYPEGHDFIIIDSGTATTIDALDQTGKHWGGLILPGVNICTESLLKNTQQLPLWGNNKKDSHPELFAKNTSQAIQSASVLGLAGAIDSISLAMEKELKGSATITKIVCGGNAKTLQPHLQLSYEFNQHLVMLGLKVIASIDRNQS